MDAESEAIVDDLVRDLHGGLILEDGPSSDNDFEDLDAYSDGLSDIDISEINPQIDIDDASSLSLSDASSFEIPQIGEIQPEKVDFPAVQQEGADTASKWAYEVEPNVLPSDFDVVVPELATKFGFELDNFQKQAIYYLEKNYSIFVAAHTSSGKTVVADYAVAMARRNGTRVIYTSPIKALSNQSYRSFKHKYEDIGIITGDVQKSPEAPCVIMTTEILRDILYKRAESLDNVEFVIFDEVHYINDLERGVVWEEVIILLPAHIKIIMLTATVSNALEFAEWVGKTKRRNFYVIYTNKRPIPLEHYIYCLGSTYKVVDKDGKFLDSGLKQASDDVKSMYSNLINKVQSARAKSGPNSQQMDRPASGKTVDPGQKKKRRENKRLRQLKNYLSEYQKRGTSYKPNSNSGLMSFLRIMRTLIMAKFLPAIIFTFSKKRCDLYASKVRVDFSLNPKEKIIIRSFISKALTRLDKADRELPQIQRVSELLLRGIAVHHGGLLPIVKEIVEILFARGLVRCLFATETFAMGVNSPARCVVFSEFCKHDGNNYREITPGEYTQMSGRAGRRGMDTFGIVIVNVGDTPPLTTTIRNMMLGKPKKLESQFRLTYNMIMNLLRIESLDIDHMISRSFSEHTLSTVLTNDLKQYNQENDIVDLPDCEKCSRENMTTIFNMTREVERNQTLIMDRLVYSDLIKVFLCIGRVIVVNTGTRTNSLAIVTSGLQRDSMPSGPSYALITDTPVYHPPRYCFKAMVLTSKICAISDDTVGHILPSGLLDIPDANRMSFINQDLSQDDIALITDMRSPGFSAKKSAKARFFKDDMYETSLRSAVDILSKKTIMDVINTFKMDYECSNLAKMQMIAISKILETQAIKCQRFVEHYALFAKRQSVVEGIEALCKYSGNFSMRLHKEYSMRLDVLRRLGFIDLSDLVTLKGRVAIEIRRISPLILTEIILENVFAGCQPEEIVAVLSIFVYNQKTSDDEDNTVDNERLAKILSSVMGIVEKIAIVEFECGVCEDVNEYMNDFNAGMINLAYDWANQKPFIEIMKTTSAMEGVIVRTMVHLEEACREVLGAARCLGNNDLATKMEHAIKIMRRDIAFSASLYF